MAMTQGGGEWRTSQLFLSCVSDEFGDYRDALRSALTRLNVEIKIQEEFQAMDGDTLALLETYVESGDVVVHFIGDMAGSAPALADSLLPQGRSKSAMTCGNARRSS